ncbi:CHAT domain-containing protein [Nocardia sp. NPDC051570]|uniref:CHAT domain-containing protein n=1 Tax=Nocardia sp. NPDC051570 TaxID=3364324 RepID=UPI0037B34B76
MGSPEPLLLATPMPELLHGGPGPQTSILLKEADRAGAFNGHPVVRSPIPLPRELVAVALSRDLDRDVADPESACRQLAAQDASVAAHYRVFLDNVAVGRGLARIAELLYAIVVSPPAQVLELIGTHPELTTGTTVRDAGERELRAAVGSEVEVGLRMRQRLLDELCDGRTPPTVAIQRHFAAIEAYGHDLRTRAYAMYREAVDADGPEGIALMRAALRFAGQVGEERIETDLAAMLGERLTLAIGDGSQADPSEAVAVLELALSRLPEGSVQWAWAANVLAGLIRLRGDGDRGEDWENARRLYAAAALVDRQAYPDMWSMIQTNYGLHLAERPDRDAADLTDGLAHISAGLEERSAERDTVNWAYSMINLGMLLERRGEPGDLSRAEQCYRNALAHLSPADETLLWLRLQCNLARRLLRRDRPDVVGAKNVLTVALGLATTRRWIGETAHIKRLLAEAEGHIHGSGSAEGLRLHREALAAAPARVSPALHLDIAGQLFELYASAARWTEAADVAADMVVAMDALYDAQVTVAGRRSVLAEGSRLARWAAVALARAGRGERAIEALEHGLAREFSVIAGRDAAELDALEHLDPTMAARYRHANTRYRTSIAEPVMARPHGVGDAMDEQARAERDLRAVTDEIRAIPGFEGFLRTEEWADVVRACGGVPLVYLANAPGGSYVLVINPVPDSAATPPTVHAISVPEVTSETIAHQLVANAKTRTPGLLMWQDAGALTRRRELPAALRGLAALAPLLRPVADLLANNPQREVVVIPTGLLALAPLHAVPIDDETVLDDIGTVFVAPSAALFAAARSKAARSAESPPCLVAVADPDGSLPGSRAELAEIVDIFQTALSPSARTWVATGPEATTGWALDHFGDASYLHLSCHGKASTLAGGSLAFAEGHLDMDSLVKHQLPRCRLAVASACQSGHYEVVHEPDQFRGLPAGFLAAGAACAVTSLWQVDDWVTAILMTRFYEYVLAAGLPPVPALRQARLWLRGLTSQDLLRYLTSHPHLAGLAQRYVDPAQGALHPFASPVHWAAFTAWGI